MRQTGFDESLGTLEELDASRQIRRTVRRVPYDYVALFRLAGRRGNTVSAAINISAEAAFICTSIGYSLEEPEIPEAPPGELNALLPPTVYEPLFRRDVLRFTTASIKGTNVAQPSTRITAIPNTTNLNQARAAEELFALQAQNLRESLSFKYAIIDKGSGRELQNTPVHNLAGLGKADGTRPFRELPVPYVFAPNSSIVIELYEIVTINGGTVHMDFQGFKEFR